MPNFNIVTFNMHGFNQGETLVKNLCSDLCPDVIFIQENWLTPDLLHKMESLSLNYSVYGISAMEKVVRNDIILGRPFGGVSMLIKSTLDSAVVNHVCAERYNIISIGNLLLVNVYLPSASSVVKRDECIVVIEEIIDIILNIDYKFLIFGGDINCDPDINSPISQFLGSKLGELGAGHIKFKPVETIDNNNIGVTIKEYTHILESNGYFSCIDHFFTSLNASSAPVVAAIENFENFSDHIPVLLRFQIDMDCLNARINPSDSPIDASNDFSMNKPNWEKADFNLYYHLSYAYFDNIMLRMNDYLTMHSNNYCNHASYGCASQENCTEKHIDEIYVSIIEALKKAGNEALPIHTKTSAKFWWNHDLQNLKLKAIDTHEKWLSAGKPRSGPIFQSRNAAKYDYRWHIKQEKLNEKKLVTDKLQSDLCNKSQNNFWKTWKTKFKIKQKSPTVDGLKDNKEISKIFADKVRATCSPHSRNKDDDYRSELASRLFELGAPKTNITFDAEIVETAVNKIKKGKAADRDGLTVEHIMYAHPIVISLIGKLFNLMLKSGFAPDGFGKGLSFLIPKTSRHPSFVKSDDFRVITICPIISKIFEHCVLLEIEDFLTTSSRQFGFKKFTGCNHANFLLKETVDYFTSNDSNVCLGTLDLSKAFDKVNHAGLFLKLLDKKVSLDIVHVLINWYSKTFTTISWNGALSECVQITSGVRQGGILSPIFFSVYVDDLLNELSSSGLGCFVNGFCFNSLMYADDLILLTITISDLRSLLAMCSKFFMLVDMPVNFSKSNCIRIGTRFKSVCAPICLDHEHIYWVREMKYLGVSFFSGKSLLFNTDDRRKSFYSQFNTIYGRLGNKNNISLIIFLLKSICIPTLIFGTEIMGATFTEKNKLCNAFNRCCMKIFSTFNNSIIRVCQYFSGILPLEFQLDIKRINFLNSLDFHPNVELRRLFSCFILSANPGTKYGIVLKDSSNVINAKVWSFFTDLLHNDGLV
jgi:exonuclease III